MSSSDPRPIAIVTDSTADIPPELIEEYGIHVVPQILIMGDKTWRDRVDIDSPTFYELLKTSSRFPSTSQPSATEFSDLFTRLAVDSAGIVAVLVSNEFSGTLSSARTAAANLPDIPIEIVDSRATSMQLGFTTLVAARVAAQGGSLEEVAVAAQARVGRVHVYFLVDTLEYLHRGGRIGGAAKLVGSALNLKPILEIRDGIITPLTRVRTRRKALEKLHELLDEHLASQDQIHMAVLHVAAADEAARLMAELDARFDPIEMIASECSPVIGAHAGPGTVGVAFYSE